LEHRRWTAWRICASTPGKSSTDARSDA
jgi:hypothetical protein